MRDEARTNHRYVQALRDVLLLLESDCLPGTRDYWNLPQMNSSPK
jgi:hypothetical protein